jgi:hypothetical protein
VRRAVTLNHTLKQPVRQAAIHHAFERLSDVVFDVVADLAFKKGNVEIFQPANQ